MLELHSKVMLRVAQLTLIERRLASAKHQPTDAGRIRRAVRGAYHQRLCEAHAEQVHS